MKRALAIAVAACTFGVAGFGITLSGVWRADVELLPDIELESELILRYTVAGFVITSESDFGVAGLDTQRFGVTGPFGPLTITGNMWFAASPAMYEAADLTTTLDFGGITIGATIRHWRMGEWRRWDWRRMRGGVWVDEFTPCVSYQTPTNAGMQYIFTTTVAPVTVRTMFLDCSYGIGFQRLELDVVDLPLCCGITFDAALDFTRLGFEDITISGFGIPFIAGIVFDISIEYSLTAKAVTVTPRLPALGVACISVWAAPLPAGRTITEVALEGWKIRCVIGDCNYLEFVTVLDFVAPHGVPGAIRGRFNRGVAPFPVSAIREFEHIGLGFCGPGCCGGTWNVGLRIFFGEPGTPTGLFGTTRFTGTVEVPIMVGLVARTSFSMPTVTVPLVVPTFGIGWTFTF